MSRKIRNVKGMPVRATLCGSCPFGPDGEQEIKHRVMARSMQVSQTCHSSGTIHGRKDTLLCRGARLYQCELMYRAGIIEEPTIESWQKKQKKLGM